MPHGLLGKPLAAGAECRAVGVASRALLTCTEPTGRGVYPTLLCRDASAAYDQVHDTLQRVLQMYIFHLIDTGAPCTHLGGAAKARLGWAHVASFNGPFQLLLQVWPACSPSALLPARPQVRTSWCRCTRATCVQGCATLPTKSSSSSCWPRWVGMPACGWLMTWRWDLPGIVLLCLLGSCLLFPSLSRLPTGHNGGVPCSVPRGGRVVLILAPWRCGAGAPATTPGLLLLGKC